MNCVEAAGSVQKNGYIMRSHTYAHRAAYEQAYGVIPAGFHVHHTCHNKRCVNPEHLQAIDGTEHARMHAAERITDTCIHGHTKLDGYVDPSGKRKCRTCHKARRLRHYYRTKGNK